MSIFERRLVRKVYLDDTHPLSCSIINTENSQGHTEYVIRVQRGLSTENVWHVYKRYNDFVALHNCLQGSGIQLFLPPKKLIGNFDRGFIAERQIGLQKYLDQILQNRILASTLIIKRFLDPENYGTLFQDLGLTQICIALRGELNVEIVKPLPDIGWRLRKKQFIVNLQSDTKHELILSWVPFGPDKLLEDKQVQSILKSLCTLQHTNISPLELAGVSEGGGWVIRNISKNGSLLDVVCGVKQPHTLPAYKKYSNYKSRKSLPVPQIIDIVSQILQGLAYLHYKGIPYGHLHLGNIRIVEGIVKLLDIENSVFGLPCFYRPYLIENKIISLQAVDVYCLGLVMYELIFSEPLPDAHCHSLPSTCPLILKPILESILTVNGIKAGMPTISSLLNLDIFRRSPPKPHPYIKLSNSLKQFLLVVSNQIIVRMKEDHSKVREQRRSLKLQAILNADEQGIFFYQRHKSSKKNVKCDVNANGKWNERSGSPTSTSTTATSAGTTTPPAPPILSVADESTDVEDKGRTALLGDICNFKKEGLRRVQPPA